MVGSECANVVVVLEVPMKIVSSIFLIMVSLSVAGIFPGCKCNNEMEAPPPGSSLQGSPEEPAVFETPRADEYPDL